MLGKLGTQTLRGKTFKRKGVVWVENGALAKRIEILWELLEFLGEVNTYAMK